MPDLDKTSIAHVYYRDVPLALATLLTADPAYSYIKDGVMKGAGHNCPRLTIRYLQKGTQEDAKAMAKLSKLLEELESNNQIVSFSFSH